MSWARRLSDSPAVKLVLTHAGTLFLVFAERTLGDYEQLQGAISELGSTPRNHLRIAALGAAAVHLAPPVIHRFKTRRPDIVISVETGRVGGVLAAPGRRRGRSCDRSRLTC